MREERHHSSIKPWPQKLPNPTVPRVSPFERPASHASSANTQRQKPKRWSRTSSMSITLNPPESKSKIVWAQVWSISRLPIRKTVLKGGPRTTLGKNSRVFRRCITRTSKISWPIGCIRIIQRGSKDVMNLKPNMTKSSRRSARLSPMSKGATKFPVGICKRLPPMAVLHWSIQLPSPKWSGKLGHPLSDAIRPWVWPPSSTTQRAKSLYTGRRSKVSWTSRHNFKRRWVLVIPTPQLWNSPSSRNRRHTTCPEMMGVLVRLVSGRRIYLRRVWVHRKAREPSTREAKKTIRVSFLI